jgi:hypothetical protein
MATDYKEMARVEEEALRLHLAGQQGRMQQLREARVWEAETPPGISTPDGQYLRGYIDEEGNPTESGELFVELLESGLYNNRGEFTDKGRAFALEPDQALDPSNWEAFAIRYDNGLYDQPDTSFGDAVGGVAGVLGDAFKGAWKIAGAPIRAAIPGGKNSAEEMADGVLTALETAEGAADSSRGMGSGINSWMDQIAAGWADNEKFRYQAIQRHEKHKRDLEDFEIGEIIGGMLDSQSVIDGINAVHDVSTLISSDPEAAKRQGNALGVVMEPSNLATMGVGGSAAKVPLLARMGDKGARVAEAAMEAERIAAQVAKNKTVLSKTTLGAEVAAKQTENLKALGKTEQAAKYQAVAQRLAAEADQLKTTLPEMEASAAARTQWAAKVAEDAGSAPAIMAAVESTRQLARQVRAAPARVMGPVIEKLGEGLVRADTFVQEQLAKLGLTKETYAAGRTALAALGLPAGGGLIATPAAILTAGPLLRGVGAMTRTVGKELLEARGSVPFWQKVAQSAETPLGRSTAHLMDNLTLGGKVFTPFRRIPQAGKGIAAAVPVDVLFEGLASGGGFGPQTIKQGIAESLVFAGGPAVAGAFIGGKKADFQAKQAGDEINLRRRFSPEEAPLFSRMPTGARKNMAAYSATFPEIKFKLKDNGSSHFDRTSNTITINTADPNWLKPLIAHEVNHFVQVKGQIEEGIAASLVGDGVTGGFLRRADGTLDPNFMAAMEAYNRRMRADNLAPLNAREFAIEYFNEATVNDLMESADSGKLQRDAGRSDLERMVRGMSRALVPKVPLLRDLFFRTGGAVRPDGRMVEGNGLLAAGVRELPGAKEMMRKIVETQAGRRDGKISGDGAGVPIALAKGDPALLESMFSYLKTDADGKPILDSQGNPQVVDRATDQARAAAGLRAAEVSVRKVESGRALEPGELAPKDGGKFEGTHLAEEAIRALKESGVFNRMQLAVLRMLNRASKDFTGETFMVLNQPATLKGAGKSVKYGTLPMTFREAVPVGVSVTKAGNLLVHFFSVTKFVENIRKRAQSKRGKRLYGGDEIKIREDAEAVMNLHRQGLTTDAYFAEKYGPVAGPEYKNFINSIFGLMSTTQKDVNPLFAEDHIGFPDGVYRTYRLDRINKTTRMQGRTPLPFIYDKIKLNHFPNGVPESAGNRGVSVAESGRANRPAGAPEIQDGGAAQGAVSQGELVAVLSPNRKPPLYGQVFQSSAEISRQKAELKNWAASNGLALTPDQASALTRGKQRGGGEEHDVFRDGESVIKATRGDSWAAGASPAQYFQRWEDIGRLWPALKPEVIGIEGDRIWTRQTFIDGDVYSNPADLTRDMDAAGWDRVGPRRFKHRVSGAVISDVKPSNVIRGKDGRMWPFDVIVDDIGTN